VAGAIATVVEEPSLGAWAREVVGTPRARFRGYVGDRGLTLQPVLSYRNPSRPVIAGSIRSTEEGSRVKLSARPPLPTVLFFGLVVMIVIGFAREQVSRFGWAAATPYAGVVALMYAFVVLPFGFEARRAVRVLVETAAGARTKPAAHREQATRSG